MMTKGAARLAGLHLMHPLHRRLMVHHLLLHHLLLRWLGRLRPAVVARRRPLSKYSHGTEQHTEHDTP